MTAGATKNDNELSPIFRGVSSYFPRALLEVGRVSNFGATKYAWGGWRHVPDGYNRYQDALGRHILKRNIEGEVDSDSKLLHHAHVAWNALAVLELYLMSLENNDGN